MSRPSFRTIFMGLAWELSRRSTCLRLSVGCVITSADYRYVFSIGYNGNVAGGANTCDVTGDAAVGACGDLHAEENAVINCTTPRSEPKVVFVTHLPCSMCAKRLVNMGGVQQVFYDQDYRLRTGEAILRAAGINVSHQPTQHLEVL